MFRIRVLVWLAFSIPVFLHNMLSAYLMFNIPVVQHTCFFTYLAFTILVVLPHLSFMICFFSRELFIKLRVSMGRGASTNANEKTRFRSLVPSGGTRGEGVDYYSMTAVSLHGLASQGLTPPHA